MNPGGPAAAADRYDVVIVGGALAGAATAILLLRERPTLRVLILERSQTFSRRVGEATVEVSGYFLGRVLGLTEHLNQAHLVKQGMRFWFYNNAVQALPDCSEIGGKYLARVPAYQVDRAVLDQEILERAQALGATLLRPATTVAVELNAGGTQIIEARTPAGLRTFSARWVVDASGVAAVLARQEGWWTANEAHPTSACWARWTGVKNWDGLELSSKYPTWSAACHGLRFTATNHLVGQGWWAWFIPLKGGDVSIGVVFDERFVEWPQGGSLGDRLKTFLLRHPAAREIAAEAQWIDGDVHFRKRLPYYSRTMAGDGFVLVGDAAGFIDPFYSPGMDWASFSVSSAAHLILAEREGQNAATLAADHDARFLRSYHRWFEAIYRDKYEYMGDFELMRLAFLLDLGLYYLGIASQPYKRGAVALREPVFSTAPSTPFFHLIRTYNRRFARMAAARRARGVWGRRNHHERFLFGGYTFHPRSALPVLKALGAWALLELGEGWRTWFRARPKSVEKSAHTAGVPNRDGLGVSALPR